MIKRFVLFITCVLLSFGSIYADDITLPFAGGDGQGGSALKGDLNNDKTVTVSDLTMMVNLILSGQYSKPADLNNDGSVNVQDITILVNIILGGDVEINTSTGGVSDADAKKR